MIIFWSNNFNCFVFHCGKWIVIHLSCYLYFTFERFVTYEILFIIFINVKANVNIDKCTLFLFLLYLLYIRTMCKNCIASFIYLEWEYGLRKGKVLILFHYVFFSLLKWIAIFFKIVYYLFILLSFLSLAKIIYFKKLWMKYQLNREIVLFPLSNNLLSICQEVHCHTDKP